MRAGDYKELPVWVGNIVSCVDSVERGFIRETKYRYRDSLNPDRENKVTHKAVIHLEMSRGVQRGGICWSVNIEREAAEELYNCLGKVLGKKESP